MKKGEISNNTLIVLITLSIVVSLLGTWVSLTKLRIPSITGFPITPSTTGVANVTINSTVSINCNMTNCNVFFRSQNPGDINDTMDNAPPAFNITNDGSVRVNVTVRKSAVLFQGTGGDTDNFYMNATCGCAAARCCGNYTNITASGWYSHWINITTSDVQIVDRLNFTDGSDSVRIEIRIEVPTDEPSGTRSSTLTFTATAGE